MFKPARILVVLAVGSIVAYFIGDLDQLGGGVLLPLGVVLLIGAFIHHLMGREVKLYEQDKQRHPTGRHAPRVSDHARSVPVDTGP